MSDWLPLFGFGGAVIVAMFLVARYQSNRYTDYLAKHTEETHKITTNQEILVAQNERMVAAQERIAAALEAKT